MSTSLTITSQNLTPADVARDLMATIKRIEEAVESSGREIGRIEGRGMMANIFSSSRDDLVAISRSQRSINDLMLDMIREIITLNVMSYSYLAGVLDEFVRMSQNGWKDQDGRIQRLSNTGKDFADTAGRIFGQIIEGSRSTQQAIELNAEQIDAVRGALAAKAEIDEAQSRHLERIDGQLVRKAEAIGQLSSLLAEKAEVDARQSQELQAIGGQLETKAEQLRQLTVAIVEKEQLDARQSLQLEALGRLVDEKAEQITRLGHELAEQALLDERQSRELEAVNLLIEDAARSTAKLEGLVRAQSETAATHAERLDAVECRLEAQRLQIEAAAEFARASTDGLRRGLIVAGVLGAVAGCGGALIATRLLGL